MKVLGKMDNSKQLTIYYFSATWCGPCKRFKPILETVVEELKDKRIQLNKIDIDEQIEMTSEHEIRSVPTMILKDEQGNVVARHSGILSKEDLKHFILEQLK